MATFRGGVHPKYFKELTEKKEVKKAAIPKEVVVSLESKDASNMRNIKVTDELGRFRREGGKKYSDIIIDEVRWSKTIKNSLWIETSFNTMNYPSSFIECAKTVSKPGIVNSNYFFKTQISDNMFPILQKILLTFLN